MKEKIYVFQWISDLGGADTRLKELLLLLKDDFDITCIPNDEFRLREKHNTDFLDSLNIKYCMANELPEKMEGLAYANSNFRLFSEKQRIKFIKDSGLKFIWSNDMMWHTKEEIEAIKNKQVDVILFTSVFHKNIMITEVKNAHKFQKTFIIENYFDSNTWPYIKRINRDVPVFGKSSRADVMKFSENFPLFYDQITCGIKANFSILGWSKNLEEKYNWYEFDTRWKMYTENQVSTQDWLSTIDIFLYNCNHRFIENQSRSVIEAQLSGCPVIAPRRWNFPNMIDGKYGCLYENLEQAINFAKDMTDLKLREKTGKMASDYTRETWCNKNKQKDKWGKVINYAEENIGEKV